MNYHNPRSDNGPSAESINQAPDVFRLRDYFAAAVLNGLLAAGRDAQYGDSNISELSSSSHQIADAMMKARKA